jgi:hypothetical protein
MHLRFIATLRSAAFLVNRLRQFFVIYLQLRTYMNPTRVVAKHYRADAFFDVPIENGEVTMVFNAHRHQPDYCAVVWVEELPFRELWKNEEAIIHLQAFGNPEIWRKEERFDKVGIGFGESKTRPMPMGLVHYEQYMRRTRRRSGFGGKWDESYEHVDSIGFTDGITRSIWLMSHGARFFPIRCTISGAEKLHDLAGAPGSKVWTVKSLLDLAV